jgi:hypothetical protein
VRGPATRDAAAWKQKSKLWELRAAQSLARLRRDQGRRAEARDLLAPVYCWFIEGFSLIMNAGASAAGQAFAI